MKKAKVCEKLQVKNGKKLNLKKFPTSLAENFPDDESLKVELLERTQELSALQDRLYASNSHSLLLIFQAMDAAGKDSAIKNVMSGVNPQGCQVYSFKHPSAEEARHDFLWRCSKALPERGRIGIFNRSYYEEVLIARVHPEILKAQNIPEMDPSPEIWKQRYESIRDFERHLHRNGTRILKFYLHISKGEQRRRFLKRIDEPTKNWKFSPGDLVERKFWKQYQEAYRHCLEATSTRESPWFVIPSDDKRAAQVTISRIVGDCLKDLKLQYPKLEVAQVAELKKLRKILSKD